MGREARNMERGETEAIRVKNCAHDISKIASTSPFKTASDMENPVEQISVISSIFVKRE